MTIPVYPVKRHNTRYMGVEGEGKLINRVDTQNTDPRYNLRIRLLRV